MAEGLAMGRWWRRGKREPQERSTFSVLELGSSSTRALVIGERNGYALVHGWGEAPAVPDFYREASPAAFAKALKSCEAALTEAEDITQEVLGEKVVPDWVVVGIPGPWVRGISCTIQRRRTRPEARITPEEMERLLERTQRLALLQACRQLRLSQEELCLLHTRVVELFLGDRKVSDPFLFSSSSLSITICDVFAPTAYLEAVHTIVNGLQLELLGLVAQPQALCQSLGAKDGVYLDLGEWRTDIAVTKGGGPFILTGVPWGGRDFTQELAARLGLSLEQGEKLKLDYCSGWVDETTKEAIEEVLRVSAAQWLGQVVRELRSVRGLGVLPHRMYLCGGGSLPPAVGVAAAAFPWMERLPFDRHPEISSFHPHQVHGVTDRIGVLNSPRETVITALAQCGAALKRGKKPPQGLNQMLQEVSVRSMNSFVPSILQSGRGN